MSLKEQIISFIFSIIYGIIMSVVYNKCYKYLYLVKKIYCFFNNLLFYLDSSLIYFIVFRKINNGIINIYFIFITAFLYILTNSYFTNKMSIYDE